MVRLRPLCTRRRWSVPLGLDTRRGKASGVSWRTTAQQVASPRPPSLQRKLLIFVSWKCLREVQILTRSTTAFGSRLIARCAFKNLAGQRRRRRLANRKAFLARMRRTAKSLSADYVNKVIGNLKSRLKLLKKATGRHFVEGGHANAAA